MSKIRISMAPENRAKQFAPFAALKGQEMELAKKRETVEERISLAEDEIERVNGVLTNTKSGDEVRITYYCKNAYVTLSGPVEKIFAYESALQIKGKKIMFKDIYRIENRSIIELERSDIYEKY